MQPGLANNGTNLPQALVSNRLKNRLLMIRRNDSSGWSGYHAVPVACRPDGNSPLPAAQLLTSGQGALIEVEGFRDAAGAARHAGQRILGPVDGHSQLVL